MEFSYDYAPLVNAVITSFDLSDVSDEKNMSNEVLNAHNYLLKLLTNPGIPPRIKLNEDNKLLTKEQCKFIINNRASFVDGLAKRLYFRSLEEKEPLKTFLDDLSSFIISSPHFLYEEIEY